MSACRGRRGQSRSRAPHRVLEHDEPRAVAEQRLDLDPRQQASDVVEDVIGAEHRVAPSHHLGIGEAVAGGLAGAKGLAVAAVGLAVMIPLLNIISVIVLARHGDNASPSLRGTLIQLARNPFIWSCAVGAVINIFHIPIPPFLVTFGYILGRASLALGLLVVGAGLRVANLRRPQMATWLTTILKLLVLPPIAVAVGYACGLREIDLLIVAVLAAVPSAPNGYVLARQMGGDAPLLAEILTVQTLCAAITLPLIITAVGGL